MNQSDTAISTQNYVLNLLNSFNEIHLLLAVALVITLIIALFLLIAFCLAYRAKYHAQFDLTQVRLMNRKYRQQIEQLEFEKNQNLKQIEKLLEDNNAQAYTIRRLRTESQDFKEAPKTKEYQAGENE